MADAGIDATISVVGIEEALRVLNTIDKSARRQLTKDYKKIVDVVVQDVKDSIPFGPPLSGMARNWTTKSGAKIFPYEPELNTVRAGVSAKRLGSFRGFSTNLATFYVRFSGPSAVIIDMAGKGKIPTKQGSAMVRGLSNKFGPPSRIMWPAWERNRYKVEDEIRDLVDNLMDRVRKEMK